LSTVFILAGSYEQARSFARRSNMTALEWRYVVDIHSILGMRQQTLWLVGEWPNRKDAEELLSLAKAREFKVIDNEPETQP